MPRSNWKGVISFGLVSIPVVLFPAENKKADISFHQIDKKDNSRIKYQRINASTGKVVPWERITRGYEYDKDTTIPVPDDVLKKVAGESARTINIDTFINVDDLDLTAIDHNYYLVPDKGGEKGYVILREALFDTHKMGIAKVIISTKEYLAAVMPHGDALILCLLKYDAEVRKPEEFDLPSKELSAYKVNKKEMDIAKKLIKSMSVKKWHPEKYKDLYQEAIHHWVEETVRHLPHAKSKKKRTISTKNVNFIELLKKSLASTAKPKKAKSAAKKKHAKLTRSNHKHATRH